MSYIRFVYLFLLSKSFISLSPSIFNSYIRCVYLFLSFRAVHFVILLSFSFYIVLHPLRLPPFLRVHFITSVLSLQLYPSIRYFFPFVSTLLNPVRYFLPFRFSSSLLFPIPRSFRFKLFPSLRYFLPIVSTLPSCSFTSSFHFVTSIPFVSMFPSRSFTSSFRFKPLTSLPPFFRFNSSFLFVLLFLTFLSCQLVHFIASILSLQLFPAIRYFFPFVSTLFHPVRYFFPFLSTLPFRSLYSVPFASTLLFRPLLPPHRFNTSILFI